MVRSRLATPVMSVISGEEIASFSVIVNKGLSLISFPQQLFGITNAEQLLHEMKDNQNIDVRQISRWYAGRWLPHLIDNDSNNFPIIPGEGYMIRNFGDQELFQRPRPVYSTPESYTTPSYATPIYSTPSYATPAYTTPLYSYPTPYSTP